MSDLGWTEWASKSVFERQPWRLFTCFLLIKDYERAFTLSVSSTLLILCISFILGFAVAFKTHRGSLFDKQRAQMAAIPEAWIPAFVFGNGFAAFWIFVLLVTKSPTASAAWYRLLNLLTPSRKKKTNETTNSEIRKIIAHFKASEGDQDDCETFTVQNSTEEILKEDEFPLSLPGHELVHRHVSRSQSTVLVPVSLEWRNVGCFYKTGDKTKAVLRGVCGKVKPRQMMALMGPSGAGKSTLLDILAMRKSVGNVTGEVLVNGKRCDAGFLKNSSYVPQEDSFVPTMTVLETLSFYARLVLPDKLSSKDRHDRVLDVLNMVGLGEAKDTMVGGLLPGGIHFRGLSGGERRRLSIATGVISAPCVIFLDEPTSGLDSFAALNVMQYIRSLADCKQHAVIASIHQPRTGIWNMFDQALILSNGSMMYSGAVKGVVPWFSRHLGYGYDPAMHGVVPDWVIDLVSVGFNKPKEFYGETMQNGAEITTASAVFMDKYKKDHGYNTDWEVLELEASNLDQTLESIRPIQDHCRPQVDTGRHSRQNRFFESTKGLYNSSWLSQFESLYWRSFLNITRNPADVAGRMLTFTYVGLFIGLIFYSMADGAESVITRLNLLYNSAAFYMFIPYISMSLFTADRQFYSADIQAKLYRPSAYYCSNVLSTLPFSVVNATVFALIVYGMSGLRNEMDSMIQNLAILVMESLIAIQVVHFAATVTPNQDMAFMVAIAFTALNMLLSNFFIPFEQIELNWVSWLKWLSAMGYTWNGIARVEFQERGFSCAAAGVVGNVSDFQGIIQEGFPGLSSEQGTLISNMFADPQSDCVMHTDQILEFFGIDTPFSMTMGTLVGYLCILHVLTFLGLRIVPFKDRK